MSTPLTQPADILAGSPTTRWYKITANGVAIPTNSTVEAALADSILPTAPTTLLLGPIPLTWQATAGADSLGRWELSLTAATTAQLRADPTDPLSPVAYKQIILQLQVAELGLAWFETLTVGKGFIGATP